MPAADHAGLFLGKFKPRYATEPGKYREMALESVCLRSDKCLGWIQEVVAIDDDDFLICAHAYSSGIANSLSDSSKAMASHFSKRSGSTASTVATQSAHSRLFR